MKPITAAAAIITAAALAWAAPAEAKGHRHVSPRGEFSFRVESFGRVLPVHTHRGTSYVEGAKGQTYQIRVFNHTGGRVEAVVTVDGRDVISGKPGSYRTARGYVIRPHGSVLIDGFRKSWNDVAAFRFTDVDGSYAARMGDASNVGVIGVAIFKEKGYRPPRPPIAKDKGRRSTRSGSPGTGYGTAAPKKSAPPSVADAERSDETSQGLGTGWGRNTYSPATSTHFERAGRRPNTILAARYDDRYGLIEKGVIVIPPPPRYTPRPNPDPFPASPPTFAPPPPPRYYWE